MSDSRFNADLDALVRGEGVTSGDDLTRFAADIYEVEHHMTMPHALKLRIANDLGFAADESRVVSAPISRRTERAMTSRPRSSRSWVIAFTVAAATLLALTGILRLGTPAGDGGDDHRFLGISPAVPTVEATPTADSEWLTPYTEADCPEGELIDPGEWMQLQAEQAAAFDPSVARQDEPYGTPDRDDAEASAIRQRQAMACQNRGDGPTDRTDAALPIESSSWSWENSAEGAEHMNQIWADRVERSKALSAYAEDDLGLTTDDLVHRTSGAPGPIWDPSNAVQMADGRIALPRGWATNSTDPFPSVEGFASVWVMEDGEWRLDEELFFCIGDCDNYWQQREGTSDDVATPVASPAASPAPSSTVDSSWMLPVSAEKCTLETDLLPGEFASEEFDAEPRREYQVAGPADPADASAANDVARKYLACEFSPEFTSERANMENSLSGEAFSPYSVVLLDQQPEDGISVSDQLEELGVTPADFDMSADESDLPFQSTKSSDYIVPNPNMAYELEDGRILLLTVQFTNGRGQPAWGSLTLVQESGEWKVDESVPICIGDCEAAFDELDAIYQDALWLMPITAEECRTNANLPDALSEEESAAIRSRQYRSCELASVAAPLQGPEYRHAEGEAARPLSEEIEAAYRDNGERDGSLQRISIPATVAESELPADPWTAFQPNSVVTLADGRVAMLESTVTGAGSGSGRTNPVVTSALVWRVDGETWLLDEEVTVCLGDCDAFWDGVDATPAATPIALVLPETCEAEFGLAADFTSDVRIAVNLRPGPGNASGPAVALLPTGTELQFLCEFEITSNPDVDRMDDDQRWLRVRTSNGEEGWIREIDVDSLN